MSFIFLILISVGCFSFWWKGGILHTNSLFSAQYDRWKFGTSLFGLQNRWTALSRGNCFCKATGKTGIIPIAGAGICQPDATLPRNSIHPISQSGATNSSRFTGMRLRNVWREKLSGTFRLPRISSMDWQWRNTAISGRRIPRTISDPFLCSSFWDCTDLQLWPNCNRCTWRNDDGSIFCLWGASKIIFWLENSALRTISLRSFL